MPLWSRDGHQLYFWQGGTLMAAAVHTERGFVADAPRVVFGPSRMRFFAGLTRNQYDLTPDGGFVINANATDTQSATITLVQNWKQALARRQ